MVVNKPKEGNPTFLVLGDFNSRTGKLLWYRYQDLSAESERVELIEVNNPDLQSNVRGKVLRNVCSALGLISMNGCSLSRGVFPLNLHVYDTTVLRMSNTFSCQEIYFLL